MRANRVNGLKVCLEKLSTLVQLRQECSAMPAHERLGDADGLGFRCGHRAQVVQVTRFGTVAAVPHLLRDDFGTGLDPDLTPMVMHDVEGPVRQRGADHNVDLSGGQEELDELCRLLVVPADGFGHVA